VPKFDVTLNGYSADGEGTPYKGTDDFVGDKVCKSVLAFRFPSFVARDGMNRVRTTKSTASAATISWCEIIVE